MAIKKRKRDRSAPRDTSMADLPMAIFYEIILKLSTWSIVMSKSVCRAWRDLISDPRFAKMHFAQATPCPLLRNCHYTCFSRALYLLEPEQGGDFGAGYCLCGYEWGCCHRLKVKCMLKIPIRNARSMIRGVDTANLVFSINARDHKIQASAIVTSESWEHRYESITSCNGFLCLATDFDCVICNPITGEFIRLPEPPRKERSCKNLSISLGFNPKSDQYKVLNVFQSDQRTNFAAEIHTIGTTSWRSLGTFSLKLDHSQFPCCFNGVLHWLFSSDNERCYDCIACFDLEEERFRSCSIPLPLCLRDTRSQLTIRVLGNRICVTSLIVHIEMHIWVMDFYGAADSWTKSVSVDLTRLPSCQPLSGLSDGAFLLFADSCNKLIQCDETGKFKYKKIISISLRLDAKFVAVAHTPSFVSLKSMVNTDDVEIFNVYSGCGKIKLKEEDHSLSLCARDY